MANITGSSSAWLASVYLKQPAAVNKHVLSTVTECLLTICSAVVHCSTLPGISYCCMTIII